jgi:pimeloyl-ACP methyl ester carboxylesterase
LQKQQRHRTPGRFSKQLVFFAAIVFVSFLFSSFSAIRINKVHFNAADGLRITAEEYIIESGNPYILLFHEQGSSRGEFSTIARRLCKLNYNCLAVDLRNGGKYDYVSNETARQFRETDLEAGPGGIEQDIEAAITYAREKSTLPVVLFGSGANGSLCLKVALSDSSVSAVIALSPGEYFMPELKIQDAISHLQKPVFISSSKTEFPYVSELASGIETAYVTLFEPKQGAGDRGTRSLMPDYKYNNEYWIALMLFFKDLM